MSTGVCNLGSINLVKFYDNGSFDFAKFINTIITAVRFLDNINDISNVPLPEYKESMLKKRRIGLGTMGLGSLHYMMGIRYGSPESLDMVRDIYKIKAGVELLASAMLGEEKGSFELFDSKEYFNTYWWKNIDISEEVKSLVESVGTMRNSCHSANAPNGNCVRKNTKIRTAEGVKSISQIFKENKIDITKEKKNQSFIPIKTLEVPTLQGNKRITGLYINDNRNVYSIKTDMNNKIDGTSEHKLLVKISDTRAKWIELQDLKVGDKILIKK